MISDRSAARRQDLHSWAEWRLIRWSVILHCALRDSEPDGTGCSNDKGADSIVRNPCLRAARYK